MIWAAPEYFHRTVWQVITEDNGNRAYRGSSARDCAGFSHIGLSSWKDYAVELRVKWLKGEHLEITVRTQNFDNFCALGIYPPLGSYIGLIASVKLLDPFSSRISAAYRASDRFNQPDNGCRRKTAGNWTVFNQQPFPLRATDWKTVHIEVKGDLLRASINGRSLPDAHDTVFANGYLGLIMAPDTVMLFDDIRVWSL